MVAANNIVTLKRRSRFGRVWFTLVEPSRVPPLVWGLVGLSEAVVVGIEGYTGKMVELIQTGL